MSDDFKGWFRTLAPSEDERRERAEDPRSGPQLLAAARGSWNSDDDEQVDYAVSAVMVLAARGSREALDLLLDLSRSDDVTDRAIAATGLGRIGSEERPVFVDEVITRLIELTRDPDESVVSAALGSMDVRLDPRVLPRLAEMAQEAKPRIRYQVAKVLGLMHGADSDAILLQLMEDHHPKVRDMATFGIGTQHGDSDSNAIREALFRRTEDDDPEARGEALKGLAGRGDERVFECLRSELRRPIGSSEAFEAVEILDDRRLLPELRDALAVLEASGSDLAPFARSQIEKWTSAS